MIEEFCRKEFKLIQEDGRLNDLISTIEIKNQPQNNQSDSSCWEDSYDEPLNIPVSSEFFDPYNDGLRL